MTVTIITVVLNNELINSAIQSVLKQDYPHIEYIVIDGGSVDNTLKVIKGYGEEINKLVSEPDLGIYDAINKGIKLATGSIIGIMNSDDVFADNNVVSRVVAGFRNNPDAGAAYADILFTDKTDINKVRRYYSSGSFRPWMFRFGTAPAHPAFYVKRELFERYGMYKVNFDISGDFELLLRFLLIHQVNAVYIKDVWVKMRQGGVSTSGIRSILKQNAEIIGACKLNGIYTNSAMIYAKYLVKWWGFIFKNR